MDTAAVRRQLSGDEYQRWFVSFTMTAARTWSVRATDGMVGVGGAVLRAPVALMGFRTDLGGDVYAREYCPPAPGMSVTICLSCTSPLCWSPRSRVFDLRTRRIPAG